MGIDVARRVHGMGDGAVTVAELIELLSTANPFAVVQVYDYDDYSLDPDWSDYRPPNVSIYDDEVIL